MKTMPLFCALPSALGHNIAQFLDGLALAKTTLRTSICRMTMVATFFCCYDCVVAQDGLQSTKPDTFLHTSARPVFAFWESVILPSTAICELRLTEFPTVHVRKLSVVIRFDKMLPEDFDIGIAVVSWQAFPEKYSLTKRILDGILYVDLSCPMDLDLMPGPCLQLRWETATGLPQATQVTALDGIVISDNIDGFRQSWTAPLKWAEKREQ